jgi:hypothetical protein
MRKNSRRSAAVQLTGGRLSAFGLERYAGHVVVLLRIIGASQTA